MENQNPIRTEEINIDEFLKEQGIRKSEDVIEEEVVLTEEEILKKHALIEDNEIPEKGEDLVKEALKQSSPNYASQLKEIVELGLIEDIKITVGEGEEAKDLFLSELENLSKDELTFIVSKYREEKDKENKEKFVSVEGLDERTKKYLEIKKAGGDPSELIKEEIQYVNPWANLDLDDEKVQQYIVTQSLLAQGVKEKYIKQELEDLIKENTLDLEAQKIYKNVQKQFDDKVEAEKQRQLQEIEEDKKIQKEFRKSVGTELKTLIPNEDVAKVILDNATKRDATGLTNTDKIYFDSQKDPKVFAEIAYFLNNREKFLESVGAKIATKTKGDTIKTLFTLTPSVVKTAVKETKKDDDPDALLDAVLKRNNITI